MMFIITNLYKYHVYLNTFGLVMYSEVKHMHYVYYVAITFKLQFGAFCVQCKICQTSFNIFFSPFKYFLIEVKRFRLVIFFFSN